MALPMMLMTKEMMVTMKVIMVIAVVIKTVGMACRLGRLRGMVGEDGGEGLPSHEGVY